MRTSTKSILVVGLVLTTAFAALALITQTVTESDGYQWVKTSSGKLYGARTLQGRDIIPCQYDFIYYDSDKFFKVEKKGVGRAAFDLNGHKIIDENRGYDNIFKYAKDAQTCYKVTKKIDGEMYEGFCDASGREILSPSRRYTSVYRNKAGNIDFYKVSRKIDGIEYYGIVDQNGKEIISPDRRYTGVFGKFERGVLFYATERLKGNNKLCGLCDMYGREIVAAENDAAYMYQGKFLVRKKKGERAIELPYTPEPFEGSAYAKALSKSSASTTVQTKPAVQPAAQRTAAKPTPPKTDNRPAGHSSQQATKSSAGPVRFYNTWAFAPVDGGFWVVGNGISDRSVVMNITPQRVTVDGDLGYSAAKTFDYFKTNPNGSRVYRFVDRMNFLTVTIELVFSADTKTFNKLHYSDKTITTVENYVNDPTWRRQVIDNNRANVRSSNFAINSTTITTPETNPSNGLRYPEYQRYNSRGNIDERKYKVINRAECKHCHGTGISPLRETRAGSRSAYLNPAGTKCPHCGKYDRHYHNRCSSCN